MITGVEGVHCLSAKLIKQNIKIKIYTEAALASILMLTLYTSYNVPLFDFSSIIIRSEVYKIRFATVRVVII